MNKLHILIFLHFLMLAFALMGCNTNLVRDVSAASDNAWRFETDGSVSVASTENKDVSLGVSCASHGTVSFPSFGISDPESVLIESTIDAHHSLILFIDGKKFDMQIIESIWPDFSTDMTATVEQAKRAFPKKIQRALMEGHNLTITPVGSPRRSVTFSLAGAGSAINRALQKCQ